MIVPMPALLEYIEIFLYMYRIRILCCGAFDLILYGLMQSLELVRHKMCRSNLEAA